MGNVIIPTYSAWIIGCLMLIMFLYIVYTCILKLRKRLQSYKIQRSDNESSNLTNPNELKQQESFLSIRETTRINLTDTIGLRNQVRNPINETVSTKMNNGVHAGSSTRDIPNAPGNTDFEIRVIAKEKIDTAHKNPLITPEQMMQICNTVLSKSKLSSGSGSLKRSKEIFNEHNINNSDNANLTITIEKSESCPILDNMGETYDLPPSTPVPVRDVKLLNEEIDPEDYDVPLQLRKIIVEDAKRNSEPCPILDNLGETYDILPSTPVPVGDLKLQNEEIDLEEYDLPLHRKKIIVEDGQYLLPIYNSKTVSIVYINANNNNCGTKE